MGIDQVSSPDILDHFRARMEIYTAELIKLRKDIENLGAEDEARRAEINNRLQNLLLMLSEDNIVTTQVRLDYRNRQGILNESLAMRDYLDSQRFLLKILFDVYNKPYL